MKTSRITWARVYPRGRDARLPHPQHSTPRPRALTSTSLTHPSSPQARSRSSSTLPMLLYPSPAPATSAPCSLLDHSTEPPWAAAAAAGGAAAGGAAPGVGCGGGSGVDACLGLPPRARRHSSIVRLPAGQQMAGPNATHGSSCAQAHGHAHGHGHVPYHSVGSSGATITRRRSDHRSVRPRACVCPAPCCCMTRGFAVPPTVCAALCHDPPLPATLSVNVCIVHSVHRCIQYL